MCVRVRACVCVRDPFSFQVYFNEQVYPFLAESSGSLVSGERVEAGLSTSPALSARVCLCVRVCTPVCLSCAAVRVMLL